MQFVDSLHNNIQSINQIESILFFNVAQATNSYLKDHIEQSKGKRTGKAFCYVSVLNLMHNELLKLSINSITIKIFK